MQSVGREVAATFVDPTSQPLPDFEFVAPSVPEHGGNLNELGWDQRPEAGRMGCSRSMVRRFSSGCFKVVMRASSSPGRFRPSMMKFFPSGSSTHVWETGGVVDGSRDGNVEKEHGAIQTNEAGDRQTISR